jgi:hypothetical protein
VGSTVGTSCGAEFARRFVAAQPLSWPPRIARRAPAGTALAIFASADKLVDSTKS